MKPKYGTDVQHLFSDTDSIMYEEKTEDISQDMVDGSDLFGMYNFEIRNLYNRAEFKSHKA